MQLLKVLKYLQRIMVSCHVGFNLNMVNMEDKVLVDTTYTTQKEVFIYHVLDISSGA